jgi:heterodisulfide reductase subunit A2
VGRKGAEDVAVIGGGVAGMKAALDLAALGRKVTLIDAGPSLGGKAVRGLSDDKFSKRDATLDNISTLMMDVEWNKSIKVMTLTTVEGVARDEKAKTYKLKLHTKARHVFDVCTACQLCVDPCPVTVPDEYSEGVGSRKAVFLPYFYSSPRLYVIDENTCLWYKDKSCRKCEEICPVDAIKFDADQKDADAEVTVDAVVLAMGAAPLGLDEFAKFGAGAERGVITVAQAQRLLDPAGPTGGEFRLQAGEPGSALTVGQHHGVKASAAAHVKKGERPKAVAFIQAKGKGEAWAKNGPVTLRWAVEALKAVAADSPGVKLHLFHDKEAGATMKGQLIGIQKQLGAATYDVEPVKVEAHGAKVVVVYAAPDGEKRLEVDAAVISPPIAPPDALKALAPQLGIKLDEYGFAIPEGRVQVAGPAKGPMTLDEVFEDASGTVARLLTTLARA